MSLTTDRNDPDLHVNEPSGMQKKYLVLSEEERAKGFVRPVRRSYRHVGLPTKPLSHLKPTGCGSVTTMGVALAETYARDPKFYGATFCSYCGDHFPVGEKGEFVWEGTDERFGSIVMAGFFAYLVYLYIKQ